MIQGASGCFDIAQDTHAPRGKNDDYYKVSVCVCVCVCVCVLVAQLCPILCDPMDCRLPGSSVHEILQARVLQCIAIPFSRGCS